MFPLAWDLTGWLPTVGVGLSGLTHYWLWQYQSHCWTFELTPNYTTLTDGEGADQSLVDILAALAEESSPSSSQRCAAQITALEEQDSVVGQEVPLPPDSEVLKEDEEETLHMSQTLPQEADSGR